MGRQHVVRCLAYAACLSVGIAAAPPRPHIVLMLTDDLGYNAPGYRNPDLVTPALDHLASTGVKLNEFYTYKYCAPTRASFLTGRMPYRLNAVQKNLIPWSLPTGTNLSYTMIPKKLKAAGYSTHHIGKWHQGFVTFDYTPQGRGFDTTFGFLVGGEDHYTQDASWSVNCPTKGHDLWDNGKPAIGHLGRNSTDDERYNGYTFTRRAVDIIHAHNESTPLFMYYALHNTHGPIEAPARFQATYNFSQKLRNTFNGMVSVVDESVANVTDALRAKGMWEHTVFVWATDNGSPVTVAGSNDPLRGGKGSNWEGGCRVPFFAAGGALPDTNRGKTLNGIAHIADLYATFADLAGVDASDNAGPAPVDGMSLWPWLAGEAASSPRTEIVYDHRISKSDPARGPNATGALRQGPWKIIIGTEKQASWYGHFTPNGTSKPSVAFSACSLEQPCLFNVEDDPTEHVDLMAGPSPSPAHQAILSKLLSRFHDLENEYHPYPNPPTDDDAYCAHLKATGGYVSPWKSVGDTMLDVVHIV